MPNNPTPQESQGPVAVTPDDEIPAPFRANPAEVALRTLGNIDKAFVQMGAQLAATFAQEIRGAVNAILTQMQNQRNICVPCGTARDRWDRANEAAVIQAQKEHAEAVAGLLGLKQPAGDGEDDDDVDDAAKDLAKAGWPVIRVAVPKEVMDRWKTLLEDGHENWVEDHERVAMIVTLAECAKGADLHLDL